MTDTRPAPTVPDEAVEAMARAIEPWAFRYDEGAIEGCVARASARRQAREGLTAAAPFIVAANQPEAIGQPDLDAIRARAEAATEGRWVPVKLDRESDWKDIQTLAGESVAAGAPEPEGGYLCACRPEDAEFIAHAREDVPALLAEVERLRAQRDAVLALHGTSAHWCASVSAGEHHQEFFVPGSTSWPCATATALAGDATP